MSWGAGLARFATSIVVMTLVFTASILASPMASAATIIQGSPMSGTTDQAGSATYIDTLTAPGFAGVTFLTSTAGFEIVNGDELESTAALAASATPYTITGSDSDTSGDLGSWTYSLTVTTTILQGSPTSGTTDQAGSASYTDTLSAAPGYGPVNFAVSTPGFEIVGSDELESTGPIAASATPFTITGTDSDTSGDLGSWTYSLTVTTTILQGSPTSGDTDVAGSATYTDTLSAAPGYGPVNFAVSTPGFEIVGSDELESTGPIAASATPYTITGSDIDASGDIGTWGFLLTVTADTIVQGSPTSGSTTTSDSGSFSSTLSAASGFVGLVTFTTATSGFTIANRDELKSTGPLGATNYTISGADADAYGDSGHWTFTLAVAAVSKGEIVQTSPTTGTVVTTSSGTFTTGPIIVEGSTGLVTFVTTKSSPGMNVSSSGLISTSGLLAVGTYSVSGTDSDSLGNSGTWTYTLTVTGLIVAVTFDANGGAGVMVPESENVPTALSLNRFTWTGHTFVDWNTSANGSGVSYANGVVFPFAAATTLFAQWKEGKAPARSITFVANGGTGNVAHEIDNTPTAISPNHFTRAGYTYVDWNTVANGSGRTYVSGATYSFKKSITLYAQWKKIPAPPSYVVTFIANGGSGAMAAEHHHGPAPLTRNHLTRTGYTFIDWNTIANGSGGSYANGAIYSFGSSTTLYAQWKKIKKVVPPPPVPKSGIFIGPFSPSVSTLSPSLESQIQSLASKVKSKGSSQIALLGYGEKLTAAKLRNKALVAANVELGRMRAQAVATYLEGQLNALGLKGWTISLGASSTSQYEPGEVIATLS